MTKPNNNSNNGWQKCRPGLIQDASERARRMRRRTFIAKCSASALVTAGGFLFASRFFKVEPNRYEDYPDLISCIEVKENLNQYLSKQLTDKKFRASMQLHFKICQSCASDLDKAMENLG